MKYRLRLLSLVAWCAMALAASCKAQPLAAETIGNDSVDIRASSTCSTPQEDCPCDAAGEVVECGHTVERVGSYAMCSMGKRTCDGARWGACNGENGITPKSLATLRPEGLGASAPCVDSCDPYCNVFSDDAGGIDASGLSVNNVGLYVASNADAAAGVPTTALSSPGGVQGCGTTPLKATSCATAGVIDWSKCQQDHRCDVATNTCAWNGGDGYYDGTAGLPDLQVGAACTYGGIGVIPVCNRGNVAANPASGKIGINVVNAVPTDSCAAIGAPTCSAPVPTGGLAPGACMNITGCTFTASSVAAVVNAGNRDVNEGTTRCKNNAATAKDPNASGCGTCGSCDTRLVGRAFAPNAITPLAGVSVYEPNGPLTPFVDGVACDTCASLGSPTAAGATSGADGSFTIYSAVPGPSRLVTQSGRWRRTVDIDVPACQTTPLSAAQTRLPTSRAEGDIPKTALVQGDREALECSMMKFGVASSEIDRRGTAADEQRIQLYRPGGPNGAMLPSSGVASPLVSTLWGSGGTIDEYSALIVTCSAAMKDYTSAPTSITSDDVGRMTSWLNRGGRAFLDHWGGESFIAKNPALASTSTWASGNQQYKTSRGKVNATTPAQALMRDWLVAAGASSDWGAGWMRSDLPWQHAVNPNPANTTEWLRGLSSYSAMTGNQWSTTPAGNYSLSYSFETPLTAQPAPACAVGNGGRVIYNGMHVAPGRIAGNVYPSSSYKFPKDCQLTPGLTSEELALMYQFFQLTACALGGAPPPPVPPPPPPLPTGVVFSRDFEATCSPGTTPTWQVFQWQSQIPYGTSIGFRAATADTVAGLPSAPATAPTTADVGTASATTSTWTSAPKTVAASLKTDTGKSSRKHLRVFMTFNTTANQSPVLSNWRQLYSCTPTE